MNVALATRIGLPVAATPRTMKLTARRRMRVIAAWFHDAAGSSRNDFRAVINWGDGTTWNGRVLARGGGVYEILSTKRYSHAGRYSVKVTLSDSDGRTSTARSRAIVARRR